MPVDTFNQRALVASMTKDNPTPAAKVQPLPEYTAPTFTQVYELQFRYVWRCVRSLGVAQASVDDAVQEVFLVVQRKLALFDGGCELRTWLYAIVVRIVRRYRAEAARAAHRQNIHADSGSGVVSADLRCEVEANEQLELASRALNQLDDAKREVFVFACVEGMSAPEISVITGVPLNTVYSRLRAAKQQFEQAVALVRDSNPKSRTPV
jgi:RNA polymerase sigma-70 factor, ECF subfamily